jgi:hypothetical protein
MVLELVFAAWWVRSCRTFDGVNYAGHSGNGYSIVIARGCIRADWETNWGRGENVPLFSFQHEQIAQLEADWDGIADLPILPDLHSGFHGFYCGKLETPVFGIYALRPEATIRFLPPVIDRFVSFPIWALMLLGAIVPGIRIHQARRSWFRRKSGLCAACGYDLRASNERCPECGMAIPNDLAGGSDPHLRDMHRLGMGFSE